MNLKTYTFLYPAAMLAAILFELFIMPKIIGSSTTFEDAIGAAFTTAAVITVSFIIDLIRNITKKNGH